MPCSQIMALSRKAHSAHPENNITCPTLPCSLPFSSTGHEKQIEKVGARS